MPKPHRTRNIRIFRTTYTVDFDDPVNYLTSVQDQFLGSRREIVTSKKWVLWPPLAAMLCLATLFILAGVAAMGMDGTGTILIVLALLGSGTIVPLLLFLVWASLPPRASGKGGPGPDDGR